MNTTLNAIKQHDPCTSGWQKLLKHLGKTEADNEPLSILTILESNGLDDALWALRTVEGRDREIRMMAADFAESVLDFFETEFPGDDRPRNAIRAARDYANGLITLKKLNAAARAAASAAWAASTAARVAAWAAWAAAMDAAEKAAWAAAMDAAEKAAENARDASAAWAAGDAAGDNARVAVRNKQIEILERYCEFENIEV